MSWKRVEQDNGWDEIRTRRVRFDGFVNREFMKVKQWNNTTVRFKRDNGRRSCCFCRVKWENCDPEDWTGIVQTTHGNKILCQNCLDNFELEDRPSNASKN